MLYKFMQPALDLHNSHKLWFIDIITEKFLPGKIFLPSSPPSCSHGWNFCPANIFYPVLKITWSLWRPYRMGENIFFKTFLQCKGSWVGQFLFPTIILSYVVYRMVVIPYSRKILWIGALQCTFSQAQLLWMHV